MNETDIQIEVLNVFTDGRKPAIVWDSSGKFLGIRIYTPGFQSNTPYTVSDLEMLKGDGGITGDLAEFVLAVINNPQVVVCPHCSGYHNLTSVQDD